MRSNYRRPKLQLWDNHLHSEIIRVCLGIFTTALRNKKKCIKFSIKIPPFTSTVHCLLSDRLLCWKELILASYSFLRLLHKSWSPLMWQTWAVRQQAMYCESKVRYFRWELDCIFLLLWAVVNIPIQALVISPWRWSFLSWSLGLLWSKTSFYCVLQILR